MKKVKKSLFAILLSLLIAVQAMPVYAVEGITETISEFQKEEASESDIESDVSESSEEIPESEEEITDTESAEVSEGVSEQTSNQEVWEETSEDSTQEETMAGNEEISPEEDSEVSDGYEEESEIENSQEQADIIGEVCDPVMSENEVNYQTMAGVDNAISTGNISINIQGTYHTETADKIINKINQIRKEACDNGYMIPGGSTALKPSDYKPVSWSEDMEAIARQRAAEAAIYRSHNRPNATEWNDLTSSNNIKANAECLAWNYTGLMAGIEQWYGEKEAYVNGDRTDQTGHYAILIDPKITHFSVACFYSKQSYVKYPYTVVMEGKISDKTISKTKDSSAGTQNVPVEFKGSMVTALGIPEDNIPFVCVGDSGNVVCNATVKFTEPKDKISRTITSSVDKGLEWYSSDETIAAINSEGKVNAKKAGKTRITAKFGSYSAQRDLEVFTEGTSPLIVKGLEYTTFVVEEKIDLKNATVVNRRNKKSAKMTDSACKVTGLSTQNAGVIPVKVEFDSQTLNFDILVIPRPEMVANYGDVLKSITLPTNKYGTYEWLSSPETVLGKVGENKLRAGFVPLNTVDFSVRSDIEVSVHVYRSLDSGWVSFPEVSYPYTGGFQTPKPIVVSEGDNVILSLGTDYSIVTYSEHKNIGKADIVLKGEGYYKDSITAHFEITQGKVVIRPKDVQLCVGEEFPAEFEYRCTGLAEGEDLKKEPKISCSATDTQAAGLYEITAYDADAGSNYNIVYETGYLRIADNPVSYDVIFDNRGIGSEIAPVIGVAAGDVVSEPEVPEAEGYQFAGWYKGLDYKKVWNFDKDIVTERTVLYAKWMKARKDSTFSVQLIEDMTYTSKAIKPVITVWDGDILLKEGKDYSVSYKNNVKVNAVSASEAFDNTLPYVMIKGKGNYTDTIYMNFNIVPASIGDGVAHDKVTFSYNNQLVRSTSKAQDVFKSLKYLATMKKGTDFTMTLRTLRAYDESGIPKMEGLACKDAKVPKGYYGSFVLTVTGKGNYSGSIIQEIRVAQKDTLLKNATITLGADVKSFEYTGEPIQITPAVYDAQNKAYYKVINGSLEHPVTGKHVDVNPKEVYLVKLGKEYLVQDKDFTVRYDNNEAAGKATLTIQGKGDYSGSKAVTFQIKGKAFKTQNVKVTGIENAVYTGNPIILSRENVKLTYLAGKESETNKPVTLKWGRDFKVSYKNNINKGTVTVTFTGLESGGYTGKFSKTFKISGVNISDETLVKRNAKMNNIQVMYDKAGVKPEAEIVLTNKSGKILKKNVDYTLSYKNNTKAATMYEEKAPTITVKGKGNYSGSFSVKFTILAGTLSDENVRVEINPVAYSAKKKDNYVYKPTVKVYDGKKTMSAKKDYAIEYLNASQDKVRTYFDKLSLGTVKKEDIPRVRISMGTNGLYVGEAREIPLPIYQKKLESKYIYILVDDTQTTYTAQQVTPAVRVFYSNNANDVKLAKKTKDVNQILNAYNLTEWHEGDEFKVTYGTNITSGKNKGTVTIEGITPSWGGKLTQKFNIEKKSVK